MSNAFKDWYNDMSDTQKEIYEICMKYPFLIPDDDFEYEYLNLEIPVGWKLLFFQMCDDILPLLEKENIIDKFRFVQVKEKYGLMRCYTNGVESDDVVQQIRKYEKLASVVCVQCGELAEYITTGYILPFCMECWKDHVRHNEILKIALSKEEQDIFKTELEKYQNKLKERSEKNGK